MSEREQLETLADALDQFFYDLVFTAPEAVGDRLNQLGARITPVMHELGYPKKGRSRPADATYDPHGEQS